MTKSSKNPKSVRRKGEQYFPGDTVKVREISDLESYATILSFRANKRDIYALQIRWFYKPSDVFPLELPPICISSRELFDSNHSDSISIKCVLGKVQVLTFEEFFARDCFNSDTFFSRALWDCKNTSKLSPAICDWPTVCVCNSAVNPDLAFFRCWNCGAAFHDSCISSISDCLDCGAGLRYKQGVVLMEGC